MIRSYRNLFTRLKKRIDEFRDSFTSRSIILIAHFVYILAKQFREVKIHHYFYGLSYLKYGDVDLSWKIGSFSFGIILNKSLRSFNTDSNENQGKSS